MLRKPFYYLSALIFSIALAGSAEAAPSIGSANQTGSTISITGTGFGQHADESGASFPYLNAAWDNFETGTLNSANSNLQMDPDWPNACRIITSFKRPNSSYTMQKFYNTGQVYPRLGGYQHFPPNNTHKVFGSFWFYTEPGNQSGKFFRLRADEADQNPEGDSFISTGGGDFNIRGGCANMPNCATVWTSPYDIVPGTWHKIEFINETTSNATVYLDGRLDWSVGWWVNSGLDLGGGSARTIVGAMIDEGSGTYNYDDVYISYTEARVEICDVGGTFHDGTVRKCETQIPTSWSDTSIQVTANNGAFNENDTAYLYVIDSSGTASAPTTFTIGAGSGSEDTTPPQLSSATIDISGSEVDAVFNESVTTSGYTIGDFSVTCTTANGGSSFNLSSPSGSGTNWSFSTGAVTVNEGDSCSISFNGATDSIEDTSGNDLLSISSQSMTVVGYPVPPSIGTVTEVNGVFTVNGSNFESHIDYSSSTSTTLSRAWNDFEDGSILRDDWQHSNSGAYSTNWQVVSGATNRTNSTYFAARNNSVSVLGALEMPTTIQPTEWYSSFYLQISDTCPTTSPRGQFERIWGDSSEAMYLQPSGSSNYLSGTFTGIGSSEVGTIDTLGTNTWHRVELYMNKTSQEVSAYIDGKLQWTRADWPSATFQSQNHTWDIGVYIEQVANTCYHRFDDVYFDHTQARVEVCETGGAWSTSATKHCEIQIPTSWSDTSLTLTANHGTLSGGSTAYMYVIDKFGVASDPKTITLESTGGEPPASGGASLGVGTASFGTGTAYMN